MYEGEDNKSRRSSFSFKSSSRSLSSTPAPAPARSARSTRSKTGKVSNKIAERHFSPRTRRLATASKSHIRTRIIYHESGPFNPMNTRVSRLEFAWATVRDASENSNDSKMKDAFRRASNNDQTKKDLLTFVSFLLSKEWWLI